MRFRQRKIQFGFFSAAASGGTRTLDKLSKQYQLFTGPLNNNLQLPSAVDLGRGLGHTVINRGTGIITIKLNDNTTVLHTLNAGEGVKLIVKDASTTNGVWKKRAGVPGQAGGIGSGLGGGPYVSANKVYTLGGNSSSGGGAGTVLDNVEFSLLATRASAATFATLTEARNHVSAFSSATRLFAAGGFVTPTYKNTIDFVLVASGGLGTDFGDLTALLALTAGLSNSTRGIIFGGTTGSDVNTIQYVTMATAANALAFGTLFSATAKRAMAGCASPVIGFMAGGYASSSPQNNISYVNIATTSNGFDFANLSVSRGFFSGCSNDTRGIFAGGYTGSFSNVIDYIEFKSQTNAVDFGDLVVPREQVAAGAGVNRALFTGGDASGTAYAGTDIITIFAKANASDFGNLFQTRAYAAGTSNAHGGLQ